MSFLSALHTFGAWAEKELLKLEGEAPTIEKVASAILTYAGPALQTVVTAEAGGAAGAIVGKVIGQAQSDLIAGSSLIYDFGAAPTAGSVIGSVVTNLGSLLTAGHITNSTSVATVTKVATELQNLVTAIPAAVK